MRRNFVLPSDSMKLVTHDCRTDETKFRHRSKMYDIALLTTVMNKTKKSLNSFIYDDCLTKPEEIPIEEETSAKSTKLFSESNLTINQNLDSFLSNLSKKEEVVEKKDHSNNKVLRETIVNNQDPAFGNLLWPKSIASTVNDEIICADRFEHRVIVFNREFMFKYQIGSRGKAQGQFDEPVDLLMTELGYLYVADKNNHRVQIFREAKKYKESKVQLPKLTFIEEDDEKQFSPSKSTASVLKTSKAAERPRSYKAGTEFLFTDEFYLTDKPIRLVAATMACILAVSTENGFIFIINEYNDIVNFLKLSEANMGDLRNACLSDFGNEMILVCARDNEVNLKVYKLNVENGNYDDAYLASSPSKKMLRKKTDVVEKMELISKRKLQGNYLPGIFLRRIGYVKVTLDMRSLLIYDLINLCLLEYDLGGEFKRIVLKASNHLSNLMAFDFSTDRQHLVTAEVELREKKVDFHEPTLEEIFENEDPYAHEFLTKMKTRSKMYTFKLKTIKYQDCPCHRVSLSAKQRKTTGQTRNSENNDAHKKDKTPVQNHSSFSFYNDKFIYD